MKTEIKIQQIAIICIGAMCFFSLAIHVWDKFSFVRLAIEGVTGWSIGWQKTDSETLVSVKNELAKFQQSYRDEKDSLRQEVENSKFATLKYTEKLNESRRQQINDDDEIWRSLRQTQQEFLSAKTSIQSIRNECKRLVKHLHKSKAIPDEKWQEWSTAF